MRAIEPDLTDLIRDHLRFLVDDVGPRPSGSPANRRATDYVAHVLAGAGLLVEQQAFAATWWEPGPASLCVGGQVVEVDPAPFGRPCAVRGTVTRRWTEEGLARPIPPGAILVLDGELAAEPYFPKAFPFLDLPEQRARVERLESAAPAVVILVAAERGPMAPLEDGDLSFPYLVVDPDIGRLLSDGTVVEVVVGGGLHRGPGFNVSARTAVSGRGSILCAHVDSKVTTPGAIDNGGGVATLLAVAQSGALADRATEFVVFNGEDHFAAPGEQAWLATADLSTVDLVVNLDGVGARGRASTVAAFGLPEDLDSRLGQVVRERPGIELGPQWYESDHAMFAMRGIPTLALTCANPHELGAVLHGPSDTIEAVDAQILGSVASFVIDWISQPRRSSHG